MNEKELVGKEAAKYVEDGMVVGLGTGSTAYHLIVELGRRVREEGLNMIGVATSVQSAELAKEVGINVQSFNDVKEIDVTIDGTDEFDPALNGIKGGGGAHLIEKIIAVNSKRVIWICDHSKEVTQLGAFPLPVEVIRDASQHLFDGFVAKGYAPSYRLTPAGDKFITDSGNYLIDLHLEKIDNAPQLAEELIHLVGVVEHGLFLDIADHVIMAKDDKIVHFYK
ncbi:ribose-5-phosphate isomerase RpiA [Aerococcus agrisoli]|uniref:Ribose-5-phosphate isomerase A n=1 Tax=Aerococcus agrisoli TaxID=2487350 RepID=A0A3N4G8N0_9LACT|nr:ribose-5-phosphate isomerase RpiA [Aerococcus agrisoli]RPA58675.1 ribose-5-phosphate isomerase RpiA [Aerococcus agrisoli]